MSSVGSSRCGDSCNAHPHHAAIASDSLRSDGVGQGLQRDSKAVDEFDKPLNMHGANDQALPWTEAIISGLVYVFLIDDALLMAQHMALKNEAGELGDFCRGQQIFVPLACGLLPQIRCVGDALKDIALFVYQPGCWQLVKEVLAVSFERPHDTTELILHKLTHSGISVILPDGLDERRAQRWH